MPVRFGKKQTRYLLSRAMRRIARKRYTYNDEVLTANQRKAVRQIQRRLLAVMPGEWNDFFTEGPAVSDDFGDGVK